MGKGKRRAQAIAKSSNTVQQTQQQQQHQTGVIFAASRTSWSGPLPPPEILDKFAGVFPGCAERIVEMAEKQADHRRQLEGRVVDGNVRSQARGQILGFILAALVFVGSFALIGMGKEATGISLIICDVVALLGVFMYGRVQQRRERVEKAAAFPQPSRK